MLFRCGVDRPDIQNLFLVRVRESLIREGQGSKNDKNNSNPNNRFHTFHLRCLLFAARALNRLRHRKSHGIWFHRM